MIRAYDDNGNVVDLVEWEQQIRAEAIEEFMNVLIDGEQNEEFVYNIKKIAEELKDNK